VKWFADGRRTRVRLPQYSPLITGLVGTGVAAFASVFIVGCGFGFNPSLAVASGTMAVVIGVGVGWALWLWARQRGGRADLVINEIERTVELPLTYGRKERRTAPISDLQGVTVESVEHRGSKGGISFTYAVTLRCRGNPEKLTDWSDAPRAEAFAAWLRERLNLGAPAAPPRKARE
jgi:hypothetical protein